MQRVISQPSRYSAEILGCGPFAMTQNSGEAGGPSLSFAPLG
jgi:hypothetical protein